MPCGAAAQDFSSNPASRSAPGATTVKSSRTDDTGPKVIVADALFSIYASNMQRPSHPPSERRDTLRVGTDAPHMFARLPTMMQPTGLGRSTI
jgi:hypothetical protein